MQNDTIVVDKDKLVGYAVVFFLIFLVILPYKIITKPIYVLNCKNQKCILTVSYIYKSDEDVLEEFSQEEVTSFEITDKTIKYITKHLVPRSRKRYYLVLKLKDGKGISLPFSAVSNSLLKYLGNDIVSQKDINYEDGNLINSLHKLLVNFRK